MDLRCVLARVLVEDRGQEQAHSSGVGKALVVIQRHERLEPSAFCQEPAPRGR